MFSHLADEFSAPSNDFALVRARRVSEGLSIIDLASANVNDAGIVFPENILRDAIDFGLQKAKIYMPDSKGQFAAREAIAYYYGDAALANRIILTPGTSQSYLYLFSLLANHGEQILVPRPSYPLFDYIARIAGVRLAYYDLILREGEWRIDLESILRNVGVETKALVLVSPHNPTGHVLSGDEVRAIANLANIKKLPLIVDEVFYEFVFKPEASDTLPQRVGLRDAPLVFVLNGFSKMFALPGLKIGWIKADGEPDLVQHSLAALETLADTFLATSEPAQFAVSVIFDRGKDFLRQYKHIVLARWKASKSLYTGIPHGGFYGVRSIGQQDEHVYALRLLERHGVVVHPGYFFGLPEGYIVFSFLKETEFDQW